MGLQSLRSNLRFDSQFMGSWDDALVAVAELYAGNEALASAPCTFVHITKDAVYVALKAFPRKWCSRPSGVHILGQPEPAVVRLYSENGALASASCIFWGQL